MRVFDLLLDQDETFGVRTKCLRRIHCAAFGISGLCTLCHHSAILRFGRLPSTLQHQKFDFFRKFICSRSTCAFFKNIFWQFSSFPILQTVQDIRSRIHTNRNLVSIHLSVVHIHCDVLVLAYVETLHRLRLVHRAEVDVGAAATVAVLQQYVPNPTHSTRKPNCLLTFAISILFFADPFFPMTLLINSWFPGMLDAVLQATFLCSLLMFWLCIYHGLRQNERKFLTFYLPKVIVIAPIWLCAIVLATWEKCNELRDPTYNHFVDTGNYNVSSFRCRCLDKEFYCMFICRDSRRFSTFRPPCIYSIWHCWFWRPTANCDRCRILVKKMNEFEAPRFQTARFSFRYSLKQICDWNS